MVYKRFLILLLSVTLTACSARQTPVTPTPEHTPPPAAEITPAATSPAATDAPAPQRRLHEFFESSWRAISLRYPETVLELGLTDLYGVTDVKLNDISLTYQRETFKLMATTLEELRAYDRATLSPQEQISYDVYEWVLMDQLASEPFLLHEYPATFFLTAIPAQLIQLFRDTHPVENLQDARDYVTRLGLVGIKIDQLTTILEQQEQAGLHPPDFAVQWAVFGDVGAVANASATATPFFGPFREKVLALPNTSRAQQQDILAEAENVIDTEVIPAFRRLRDHLSAMPVYRGGDSGVWRLPDGEAYYTHQLSHFTTTDLSADAIQQLGLDELDALHAAMWAIAARLGYPQNETIVQLYDRVARDGGRVAGNAVLTTYEALVAEAKTKLADVFDTLPQADVIVVADRYGGYYIPPAFNGARPGAFYAGIGGAGEDYYAMPTLAYHETIPGHHLQIALAMEMEDLPPFQAASLFTAYNEGWALYAERLAYELDWYADDPYGALGYLQAQAFRAARLVVDTGLHAQGWTFEQAQNFFTANTGFEVGDSVNPQHQIARYLVWPGQSTSYYIGYLKIMELRQHAMDVLGDRFDLKEFHRVVLGQGSVPLIILERIIEDYLAAQEAALAPADALTEAERATLASLQQVDDYPLYTMRYHGAYSPRAALAGISQWASASPRANTGTVAWGCSLFAALGNAGNRLYGRNFDWEYSPAVLLFADPPDGYASAAMVNIAYLGFGEDNASTLLDLPLSARQALLAAPYWPFDGMNEHGLVVGMAAVPSGGMQPDPHKATLGSLDVIRRMLDHARNVDEALDILQNHNIDMRGGPALHYLLADRSGRAVLVEYYRGESVLLPNETPWHLATNFIRASVESAEGQCWRYDQIASRLAQTQGQLTLPGALDLLAQVSQPSTQWSIVYGMDTGAISVVMNRAYETVHTLNLNDK